MTQRKQAKEEDLIKNINPKITGWKNYYSTKRNEKWMQALDWYIICTFTRWYNKKHQRRKHMSRVGFVRNSIYEKGLKKMARAWRNAVERRMSESRVRKNLMHGLMRGGWNFHPPTLPFLANFQKFRIRQWNQKRLPFFSDSGQNAASETPYCRERPSHRKSSCRKVRHFCFLRCCRE